MERWKQIEYGNRNYSISDMGRIRNNITGNLIKSHIQNSGYHLVHLYCNNKGKALLIHRLVAIAFVENQDNKSFVNHKDGNKVNNNYSNLEWVTGSENMCHAQQMGLMENRNKSASNRMSKIGKAFSIINKERLLQMNKTRRKPVIQLTLAGEIIKEWPSVRAVRNSKIAQNIGKVLKGEYAQSGGFKWKWKA